MSRGGLAPPPRLVQPFNLDGMTACCVRIIWKYYCDMADEDAASTGRYPNMFGDWMNTGNSNSISGKHKARS